MLLWGAGNGAYITPLDDDGKVGTTIKIPDSVVEMLLPDNGQVSCLDVVRVEEKAVDLMKIVYPATYNRWLRKHRALSAGTWNEEEEEECESESDS